MKNIKEKTLEILNSDYGKNWLIRLLAILGLVFAGISVVLLAVYWPVTSQPQPYVYSSFIGATASGAWYLIYQFPFLAALFVGVNFFLGYLVYNKDPLLSYLLVGTASLAGLIFLIDSFNFIVLVT